MGWTRITDWDAAYDNRAHVPDFETYPPRWARRAAAFRKKLADTGRARLDMPYGHGPRNLIDLFLPADTPKGLAIYVHGGYWRTFSKSDWSHLADGAIAAGWAVAVPSHTLAPDATIPEITREIGDAIDFAAREIPGPIRLAGHSAGGHLVCRMLCTDTPLRPETIDRIESTLAISPVVDLRPLLENEWNRVYHLNETTARHESPALKDPVTGARLTAWVGGDERPEFLRQAALIANVWIGLGAATRLIVDPGHNHFTVIEALSDPASALTRGWIGD